MRKIVMSALLLVFLATPAAALTVSGTITDSAGNPIVGIKVDIFDEDIALDDLLATVYTNAMGQYSATFAGGWGLEDPDIYLNVEWRWQMVPPAGSDYSGAHVLLMRKAQYNPGPMNFTSLQIYTPKMSAVSADHDPATNLTMKDMAMNQALNPPSAGGLDDMPTATTHINNSINYYENNKGSVSWDWDQDVRLFILTNRGGSFVISAGSFFGESNPLVCIADVDFNGVSSGGNQGYVSDIYHEMGHYVHHVFNSGSLPMGTYSGGHSTNTESDGPFALVEAWASYPGGELTDAIHVNDNKYAAYRDDGSAGPAGWTRYPPNSLWRGDEAMPTGRDAGAFESGESVEGTLGGVWFGIHDDALFDDFETSFKVMVEDKPNNITDFRTGLINDVGADTPEAKRTFEIYNQHGIVYSRARFTTDPFTVPQSAPGGTAIEVSDTLYIRGAVNVKFEAMALADLGVTATVNLDRVRLKWKAASDDLLGKGSDFMAGDESAWANFGAGMISFDTAALSIADGDYDLIVQNENVDGGIDNFLPTWSADTTTTPMDPGDATTAVNLDEKYFKVVGTWYDKDRNPVTNTAIEGKVVIDNTVPTVMITVTP